MSRAHACAGAACAHPSHAAGTPRWTYQRGLGGFADWGDADRIVVNVSTLYREYRGGPDLAGEPSPFEMMASLAKRGLRR